MADMSIYVFLWLFFFFLWVVKRQGHDGVLSSEQIRVPSD
jgi:hypothetical protein